MTPSDHTHPEPSKTHRFGTLWVGGRLSPMEQACLHSFIVKGESVTLFSYGPIANLPAGVQAADAHAVVDKKHIDAYIFDGRPDLAHFSDYFRYAMIQQSGLCWIDTDIFLLRDFNIDHLDDIVGRERQGTINNAILKIGDEALVEALIAESRNLQGKNLSWGESGPLLLQRLIKSHNLTSEPLAYNILYPIDHDHIYRIFLPEYFEWCETACSNGALTLHLFNNVIVRMGYWKSMAPPEGSFLHHHLKQTGALDFFSDVYPAPVMQHVANNFRRSQTGAGLGIKAVLSQLAPSTMRSIRRHTGIF